MFGKVKKWLGIEGVKLELVLPENFDSSLGQLHGKVRLRSKDASVVEAIHIVLIERYSRGRKDEQRIDEYELGKVVLTEAFDVPGEGAVVERDFILKFQKMRAPIDEFADRNPLNAGLAWVAKRMRRVKSSFRVEAEAEVRGVALNPFDKKGIEV